MKALQNKFKVFSKFISELSFKNKLKIFGVFLVSAMILIEPPSSRNKNNNDKNSAAQRASDVEDTRVIDSEDESDLVENYENNYRSSDQILGLIKESEFTLQDYDDFVIIYKDIIEVNTQVKQKYESAMNEIQNIDLENRTKEELIEYINKLDEELESERNKFKAVPLFSKNENIRIKTKELIDYYYEGYGYLNMSLITIRDYIETENSTLYDIVMDYTKNYSNIINESEYTLEEMKRIIKVNIDNV